MKKHVIMTAVLGLMAVPVISQAAIDTEVDAELDQMYSARQAPQKAAPAPVAPGAQGGQPIYIMNTATPNSRPLILRLRL